MAKPGGATLRGSLGGFFEGEGAIRIAHISDTHVRADGKPFKKTVDTRRALAVCMDHLGGLEPKPDAVVVSGDLAQTATADDYRMLKSALDGLGVPAYVIPGNMDDRSAVQAVFSGAGYLPGEGTFLHYAIDDHPVRLIGLDSLGGDHDGHLCADRLVWLRSRLAEAPDRPTLLFMHHPPVEPGTDEPAYEGVEELAGIIAANRQVARIACGHLHERSERAWANTVVSVAASVAVSRIGLAPSAAMDPDACPVYSL